MKKSAKYSTFRSYIYGEGIKVYHNHELLKQVIKRSRSTFFITKDNPPLAFKAYDLSNPNTHNIFHYDDDGNAILPKDIKFLMKIRHHCLLPIYDCFICEESNSIVFLMLYAKYGNLYHFLKKHEVDNKFIISFMRQLSKGLSFLHKNGIAHGCLTPKNVLIFEKNVFYLIGVGKKINIIDDLERCFLPPELLENSGNDIDLEKIDIWDYGLLLYMLLFNGKLPFGLEIGFKKDEIANCLKKNELTFPKDNCYRDEFLDTIRKSLKKNPKERIIFDELENLEWLPEDNFEIKYKEEEEKKQSYFSFRVFIMENNNPVIFNYSFNREEIGYGSRSSVYLATNQNDNSKVAAKVYNKKLLTKISFEDDELPINSIEREIEILSSLDYLYIIKLIELIDDDLTNSLILFFPFAKYGNLNEYIHRRVVSEDTLSLCFYQIGLAIKYMHSKNVVHRDIKPENILVFSDNYFVLSDFSVSLKLPEHKDRIEITQTSPAFLSPEESKGDTFDPKKADIWAYGISLYYCIYGIFPFNIEKGQSDSLAYTIAIITNLLQTENLEFPESKCSFECINLIKLILQKDPTKRPDITQILESEWFNDYNSSKFS